MQTFFTQNNRKFLTKLVFGVIKKLYAVSNCPIFAFLTSTFPLTAFSKHSQISFMISRFGIFLIDHLIWSGFSCTKCRRVVRFSFSIVIGVFSALETAKKTAEKGRVKFEQYLKQSDVRGSKLIRRCPKESLVANLQQLPKNFVTLNCLPKRSTC